MTFIPNTDTMLKRKVAARLQARSFLHLLLLQMWWKEQAQQ